MKKFKVGDKVYRMAKDGRVVKEHIYSVFETETSIHYNGSISLHAGGFKHAFDAPIDVYQHEIDKLKKESKKRDLPYSNDSMISFSGTTECVHTWSYQAGKVHWDDPERVLLTCIRCNAKQYRVPDMNNIVHPYGKHLVKNEHE